LPLGMRKFGCPFSASRIHMLVSLAILFPT
jgi:hypothetical protein